METFIFYWNQGSKKRDKRKGQNGVEVDQLLYLANTFSLLHQYKEWNNHLFYLHISNYDFL